MPRIPVTKATTHHEVSLQSNVSASDHRKPSVVPRLPLAKAHLSGNNSQQPEKLMIITSFDDDNDNTNTSESPIKKKGEVREAASTVAVAVPETNTPQREKIKDSSTKRKKTKKNGHMPKSPHYHFHRNAVNKLQQVKKEAKRSEVKKQQRRLIKTPRPLPVRNNLRSKFISQAMSYIGTPYSKRYYQVAEGEPEYKGKYLDCCGLIRQVLKDLQQDFGFIPGDWNQAYQFDTLPIRVDSVQQLQPGDLIFYSGEYTSKRSKKQRYNMTHVEIFLGGSSGEETIAARNLRGVVSIFPSYKFESTLWKVEKYYFCSIDTWLNGECLTHNPFPTPPKKASSMYPSRSPLTMMRF